MPVKLLQRACLFQHGDLLRPWALDLCLGILLESVAGLATEVGHRHLLLLRGKGVRKLSSTPLADHGGRGVEASVERGCGRLWLAKATSLYAEGLLDVGVADLRVEVWLLAWGKVSSGLIHARLVLWLTWRLLERDAAPLHADPAVGVGDAPARADVHSSCAT